jgi:hypothetical protein
MNFRRGHIAVKWQKDSTDGAAATTTPNTYLWEAPIDCELVSAEYLPSGTLTAHDTNYAGLFLKKADGAGGSLATVATETTETAASGGSGNWAEGVAVPLVIATAEISKGEVYSVNITKAGSGVAVPFGALNLYLKPRQRA